MNDIQKSTAYHPALQLVFLVMIAVVSAVVFTVLGIVFWLITDSQASLSVLTDSNMGIQNLNFVKTLQIFSATGMFIASPLAFSYLNKQKPSVYYYFDKKVSWQMLLLVTTILFCANPAFDWVNQVNQKMVLPDFLKGLELWMKEKEQQMAETTKQLLKMKSYGDLAINLLMIGIIPAVGEELFFRGSMQNIFKNWFKNHHTAIWITAIIFSSIHIQFYGFFPRMLLGVLFGYFLVYGGSIWLAILGHFLNNGTAVVAAFVMQKQGKSMEEIEQSQNYPLYAIVISLIITLILLMLFFKMSKNKRSDIAYE
jgi:uncharacterized protein